MSLQMHRTPAGSASWRWDIPQQNICTPSRLQLCRGVGRPVERPVSGIVPFMQSLCMNPCMNPWTWAHHTAVRTLCQGSDLGNASESLGKEIECVYGPITGSHCRQGLLSPLLTDLFVPCRNSDMTIPNGLLMFL